MSGRRRVSQAELMARYDQLLQMRARGVRDAQLVKVAQQQWQLSERQAFRYLEAVRELEAREGAGDIRSQLAIMLHRVRSQAAKALQENNHNHVVSLCHVELKILTLLSKQGSSTKKPGTRIQDDDAFEALLQSLEC
jgi:hypothetical protein